MNDLYMKHVEDQYEAAWHRAVAGFPPEAVPTAIFALMQCVHLADSRKDGDALIGIAALDMLAGIGDALLATADDHADDPVLGLVAVYKNACSV